MISEIGPAGRWICQACGFQLTTAILRASDGAVGVNRRPVEDICPNDGTSMRPITWEEDAADANRVALEQMKRADELEALLLQRAQEIDRLQKENAILRLANPIEEDLQAQIDEALKYLAMEQGFTLSGLARLFVDCQRRLADDWLEIGRLRRAEKEQARAIAALEAVCEQRDLKIEQLKAALTAQAQAIAQVQAARPKIICLCGSTRFIEQFAVLSWLLERQGSIVLGCTLLPMWFCGVPSHFGEATGTKVQCDDLHLRKIDRADEVLVINIDGYIGESTRNEIAYATAHGKPVRYLTDEPDLLRQVLPPTEAARVSRAPQVEPPCDKVCQDCGSIFTIGELEREDRAVWGHPCRDSKGWSNPIDEPSSGRERRCESFRAPVQPARAPQPEQE